MSNIYHIIIIFSITALLGITLLTFLLNNKPRPMPLIAVKGIFALASIGLLYYYIGVQTMETDMNHAPVVSSGFLSLAAIGGVYMFVRDKVMGNSNLPKWIAFAHAASAVTGYILLWIYAAGK